MITGRQSDKSVYLFYLCLLGLLTSKPGFSRFRLFGAPRRIIYYRQPMQTFVRAQPRFFVINQPVQNFGRPQRGIFFRRSNQNFSHPRQRQFINQQPNQFHVPTPQAEVAPAPIAASPTFEAPQPPEQNTHGGPSISPSQDPQPPAQRPIVEPESGSNKIPFKDRFKEAINNRPRLFQSQRQAERLDEATQIFCKNPYKWVCETSDQNIPGQSWPDIFLGGPVEAFRTGKEILKYLTVHHFNYNEKSKEAVKNQLEETQILVTNISGPMAFNGPPAQIQVPQNYWNLFSVFHELGHIADFRVTYPLDQGEAIKIFRENYPVSDVSQIDAFFKAKRAEITADKIAAKGFAFLADPHMIKAGYAPINHQSLLKTLKSAMGFLCTTPEGNEHPSGRFRINYIGSDNDLRSVLGCPVKQ